MLSSDSVKLLIWAAILIIGIAGAWIAYLKLFQGTELAQPEQLGVDDLRAAMNVVKDMSDYDARDKRIAEIVNIAIARNELRFAQSATKKMSDYDLRDKYLQKVINAHHHSSKAKQ